MAHVPAASRKQLLHFGFSSPRNAAARISFAWAKVPDEEQLPNFPVVRRRQNARFD
jgi:hypothetical protein